MPKTAAGKQELRSGGLDILPSKCTRNKRKRTVPNEPTTTNTCPKWQILHTSESSVHCVHHRCPDFTIGTSAQNPVDCISASSSSNSRAGSHPFHSAKVPTGSIHRSFPPQRDHQHERRAATRRETRRDAVRDRRCFSQRPSRQTHTCHILLPCVEKERNHLRF